MDPKYAKVYQLVLQAMAKQHIATTNGDNVGDTDLIAKDTTDKIFSLF